jgi:hypothetical protein
MSYYYVVSKLIGQKRAAKPAPRVNPKALGKLKMRLRWITRRC